MMSIRAVARRHGVSWPVMNTLVRAWSGLIAEHRRSPHPRLKAGWQVLQQLHGLYSADDHQGALEVLDRFCDLYETGDLPEFHDIDDTIIAWSNEILAWAPHQPPQQRQNRRHPQSPTSTPPNRPRLHQPDQLRSPRTPDNMTRQPVPATRNPRFTRRADKLVRDCQTVDTSDGLGATGRGVCNSLIPAREFPQLESGSGWTAEIWLADNGNWPYGINTRLQLPPTPHRRRRPTRITRQQPNANRHLERWLL